MTEMVERAELLRTGEPVAPFTLPVSGSNATLYWNEIVGRRHIVLVVLNDTAGPGDRDLAWLRAAAERTADLNAREVTILVITAYPEQIPELRNLPVPAFQVLRDAYDEEAKRLGGAPAFYLVGKEGAVQRASRDLPPLDDLLGQIDTQPP